MQITINGKPLPADGTRVYLSTGEPVDRSADLVAHIEASMDRGVIKPQAAKPKRQRSLAQIHARIARRLPVTTAESRRARQDTRSK